MFTGFFCNPRFQTFLLKQMWTLHKNGQSATIGHHHRNFRIINCSLYVDFDIFLNSCGLFSGRLVCRRINIFKFFILDFLTGLAKVPSIKC